MKPIRIFLIKHMTAGLFMASYFKQENMHEDRFRDICFLLCDKDMIFASQKGGAYYDNLLGMYRKMAQVISSEVIVCPEPILYTRKNLIDLLTDREMKKKVFRGLKKIFAQHNIEPSLITEVYHSGAVLHNYIKYLNPKIKLIGIEHGFATVIGYLWLSKGINNLKNRIKIILGKCLCFFYYYAHDSAFAASPLASRVKKFNRKIPIKPIHFDAIRELSRTFARADIIDTEYFREKSIAIILEPRLIRHTESSEDCLKFYKEFAAYIRTQLKTLMPDIDAILFKQRGNDGYFIGAKTFFLDYFKDHYEVRFFDDITKTNLPMEMYLDIICPKVIMGNISGGLLYSKALNPQIKTYSYHPYLMDYQRRHFGAVDYDYDWTLKIYGKEYGRVFEDILPEIIPA